jgi:hypothetical protein
MPLLGPGRDPEGVLALVRDRWVACLAEVQADPGFDKARAGLIRVFRTELVADPEVRDALRGAARVVRSFPEEVVHGDATLLLARHPAWVGLCALELAKWDRSLARNPLEWAITLALAGFSVLTGKADAGRGEILWALAEEAESVGWFGTGRQLLEVAADAPFADPDHAVQVRLLLALRRLENGEPDAADLLEEVARSPVADARTVTHARHVLAELRAREGDAGGARYWFEQALASVDPDEDPAIAERLQAELATLDDDGLPGPDREEPRFF